MARKARDIDVFAQRISANLIAARGGKTLKQMAKVIGCTHQTVANREKDPLRLTLGELYLICKSEGIDMTEFVGASLKLRGERT